MSFFDFVGAMGAGGGEMARTISDIQRRKLEEQDAMDRIAMQREMMAGQDRRFDAGMAADVESARLLQEQRLAASELANDRSITASDLAHERGVTASDLDYARRGKENKWDHKRGMEEIVAREDAQRRVLDYGAGLERDASELGDAQDLQSRWFSSIIDSVEGDMNRARPLIEAEMEGADAATVDAALGRTLGYRQTANADILNTDSRTGPVTWPSSVASSDGVGGNTDLGGTEGGSSASWAQRLGAGAANVGNWASMLRPSGHGRNPIMDAIGSGIGGVAGEIGEGFSAASIEQKVKANEMTEEEAMRLIAEIRAGGS